MANVTKEAESEMLIEHNARDEFVYVITSKNSGDSPVGLQPILGETSTTTKSVQIVQKTSKGPRDLSQKLEDGPKQPLKSRYPAHLIKGVYRQLNASFYQRHRWLEYSEVTDAIYCFHCRHFPDESRQE